MPELEKMCEELEEFAASEPVCHELARSHPMENVGFLSSWFPRKDTRNGYPQQKWV